MRLVTWLKSCDNRRSENNSENQKIILVLQPKLELNSAKFSDIVSVAKILKVLDII